MTMMRAEMEFVSFDAEDVITTSTFDWSGKNMYAQVATVRSYNDTNPTIKLYDDLNYASNIYYMYSYSNNKVFHMVTLFPDTPDIGDSEYNSLLGITFYLANKSSDIRNWLSANNIVQ